MHASEPEIGRFFSEAENQRRARVAVIGMTVVRNLFGENASPIGEMIKINKVNFQVIGVLPEKGATGWRDQDDIIVLPVMTAMHRLLGKTYVDNIELQVDKTENIDHSEETTLDIIYKRHRVPVSQPDVFQIRNMADVQAALSQSSETMSLLLASIAAISLIVGGIGIMNIMLVSVTERTKEIGLRKAVGARRNDILMQFLAESVVVSVVGGIIGIILGWLSTVILSSVAGWATSVSVESILLAFFCSSFIGVIFGVYPAKKASYLHPIDALRYE
jgi:macrolide transport system ATP-binding/permease protein